MKRILQITLIFSFLSSYSQVEDISFTLAPTADYVWWDSQTGLANDFLYGGKVGFGFGEYLEISGIFQTSSSLETDFSSFGLNGFSTENFTSQKVDLQRYGGELKVNFSKGVFSPYLTLGTGIQALEVNNDKFEQIYAGVGLGLRLALGDRINLLVEGRAVGFEIDAANNLLTAENQALYGVNATDFTNEQTVNLSALAAIQIYLGGRKPGELSALDKAYLKKYNRGFQGWAWVLEPSLAYVDFDDQSLYRNTWMAGGYFGVDFTEFIGVRAYYYRALEDEKISADLDDLSLYGIEFRAKLNDGRGVNPYLILGGGYLDAASSYVASEPNLSAQSTGFANAGLGLDIPLGRTFLLTGGARIMATSSKETTNPTGPDVLQTHTMYNVGVKIQLGKKAKFTPVEKLSDNDEKENLRAYSLTATEVDQQERLQSLIKAYKEELLKLNTDIEKANQENNTQQLIQLLEEKRRVSDNLSEAEQLARQFNFPKVNTEGEYLKMTPDEFEQLLLRILEGIDKKLATSSAPTPSLEKAQIKELAAQVDALKNELELKNQANQPKEEEPTTEVSKEDLTDVQKKTREEELPMNKVLDSIQKQLDAMSQQLKAQQEALDKQTSKSNSQQKEQEQLKKNLEEVKKRAAETQALLEEKKQENATENKVTKKENKE